MATNLENAIRELGKRHGFHAISFGFNTDCDEEYQWTANVHWKGFARSGNACEHGFGSTIASALESAIERATSDRTPAVLKLPDEPLALIGGLS